MKRISKIKKLHLPLKKMTAKEKDYTAILLEDVNHNFKVFGEVLDDVKRKGETTFEEVKEIKERITIVEIHLNEIKKEIKELKLSLTKKADIERLENLELRVSQIEKYLKL